MTADRGPGVLGERASPDVPSRLEAVLVPIGFTSYLGLVTVGLFFCEFVTLS